MSRPRLMPLDAREVVAVDVDVWEALEAERDALRARVAELEAERDKWRQAYHDLIEEIDEEAVR